MLSFLQRYFTSLRKVSLRDRAFLARQLATMLDSGLPLSHALTIIGVQTANEFLRETLSAIVHDLEHGVPFSGACAKHPKIFNRVFVAAIKSGEASGKLDTVLNELAQQMEKDTEYTSKMRGALIYPAFVLSAMLVMIVIMIVKIIPQLTPVFKENDVDLPWTTALIIGLSESIIHFWWIYILSICLAIYGIRFYLKTDEGREQWNNLKISMPIFGPIYKGTYMARFSRTLGMLISAGVPIIEALKIVSDVIDNEIYKYGVIDVANEVARGVPMSVPLQRNKNFPLIISQMTMVGEQTGKMDEVYEKMAKYFEGQTDDTIKGMASLIEPVVIVIIGLGVAFVVFSVVMPLYNLTSQIK